MRLTYTTDRRIWLSHNAGMSSERSKGIIESIRDPFSMLYSNLRCRAMGINSNWIVMSGARSNWDVQYIVDLIEAALFWELEK